MASTDLLTFLRGLSELLEHHIKTMQKKTQHVVSNLFLKIQYLMMKFMTFN